MAALYVMAFGVSLFIRSNLGSSAISVTPLVWSSAGTDSTSVLGWRIPQMTVGGYTIVMNSIFVFLQILILRRRYQPYQLFQLLIGTVFSVFLDVNMSLTAPIAAGGGAAGVAWGLLLVAVAGAVMGVGVACEVRCRSVMMPGEGIQVAIAQVTGKEFSKVKIAVDTALVCFGIGSCAVFYGEWRWDIVGVGTLISMVYIGIMVRIVSPHLGWFDKLLNFPTEKEADKAPFSPADAPLVITISRQYGSGGLEVGQKVAQRLGISLYDKAILDSAAAEMKLPATEVEQRDQNISTAKLLENIILGNDIPQDTILSTDDRLFVAQSQFIRKVATSKPCVIIGRCADSVLRGRGHTLRVFIMSDKEFAARRIASIGKENTSEALVDIDRVNTARANHYWKYTGHRWGDAENYDIVINTGSIGIDKAVDIICELAR